MLTHLKTTLAIFDTHYLELTRDGVFWVRSREVAFNSIPWC